MEGKQTVRKRAGEMAGLEGPRIKKTLRKRGGGGGRREGGESFSAVGGKTELSGSLERANNRCGKKRAVFSGKNRCFGRGKNHSSDVGSWERTR